MGEEIIASATKVEGGALITERGERERAVHRGLHKKNTCPNPLTGKMRGTYFSKVLQPLEFKD